MLREYDSGHKNPVRIRERPQRGTTEWKNERAKSDRLTQAYWKYIVGLGPIDTTVPTTIPLQFTPGGLIEQIPTEDEQPIPDTSGLFTNKKTPQEEE